MKNYSTLIAARKIVGESLALGTSRHAAKAEGAHVICGVSTAHSHTQALKGVADWLHSTYGKHLDNLNEDEAIVYLTARSMVVGQSAVDLDRQAINFHLLHKSPIPFFPSTIQRKLTNRAYTPLQIELLASNATEEMRLSIELANDAGLRAIELITITPLSCMRESERDAWSNFRFRGREEDTAFVVHGKGGLKRQVRISRAFANKLMLCLRPTPIEVSDRNVTHTSFFDLTGGANFSTKFTKLSKEVLGMSHGGHGLRHSFAQSRLHNLMCHGLTFEEALRVLSNELGHFSSNNTFAYLRD